MNNDPIQDRNVYAERPQIRDIFGYNASISERDADFVGRRFEYILEQRDKLNERIRFGCLTLNSASLFAITSIIGAKDTLTTLGIVRSDLFWPVVFFGFGIVIAAIAIWFNGVHFIRVAGRAVEYRRKTEHRSALFQERVSQHSENAIKEELKNGPSDDPDFAYSKITLWLSSCSGGLWLGGLAELIWKIAAGLCV